MDDDFGPEIDFSSIASIAPAASIENSNKPSVAPSTTSAPPPKIQQPTPQALPSRSTPSSILVSPRQKGNPILASIRALPWEYGDIPSDYVLGNTTCALFLSLKYHRLHPEYIYARIRALAGKYNLRVLLTMVDIQNHEESLKELSKTSLVNNLTLILCWSAQEAAHYLELYKSYEHASPTSIRAHQATSYSEKLVEFITVPRSINKTDAYGLVSAFGSVRAAVNARPEEIGSITGWGEKKVQQWCGTVREPFRVRKAAKRRLGETEESGLSLRRGESLVEVNREESSMVESNNDLSRITEVGMTEQEKDITSKARTPVRKPISNVQYAEKITAKRPAEDLSLWEPDEDDEEALLLAAMAADEPSPKKVQQGTEVLPSTTPASSEKASSQAGGMNEGMIAALAKLRKT
ncbi:ssDNA endonuclease and repair protein rad10 [Pseudocyphellaria aurata]|nr:ssDNA endonuclease and repair protein rad10 [Pseudocyphellaria aurata]